jgi:nitrogen regulatory protein P-II 1
MRKIEAIIRASVFDDVRDVLQQLGLEGLTVSEAMGTGHQPAGHASYRGVSYAQEGIPRLRLEIVVPDQEVGPVVHAITSTARTGRIGDGLVSVMPIEEAVRIRTGERGLAALGGNPTENPQSTGAAAPQATASAYH